MTGGPDIGKYDPFEDTGDWPFRGRAPKPERDVRADAEPEPPSRSSVEDTELSSRDRRTTSSRERAADESCRSALESPRQIRSPSRSPSPRQPEPEPEPEPEPSPCSRRAVGRRGGRRGRRGRRGGARARGRACEERRGRGSASRRADRSDAPRARSRRATHPAGVEVLAGGPHGFRRNVAVVVSRFNGDITTGMLEGALAALRDCNVADDADHGRAGARRVRAAAHGARAREDAALMRASSRSAASSAARRRTSTSSRARPRAVSSSRRSRPASRSRSA